MRQSRFLARVAESQEAGVFDESKRFDREARAKKANQVALFQGDKDQMLLLNMEIMQSQDSDIQEIVQNARRRINFGQVSNILSDDDRKKLNDYLLQKLHNAGRTYESEAEWQARPKMSQEELKQKWNTSEEAARQALRNQYENDEFLTDAQKQEAEERVFAKGMYSGMTDKEIAQQKEKSKPALKQMSAEEFAKLFQKKPPTDRQEPEKTETLIDMDNIFDAREFGKDKQGNPIPEPKNIRYKPIVVEQEYPNMTGLKDVTKNRTLKTEKEIAEAQQKGQRVICIECDAGDRDGKTLADTPLKKVDSTISEPFFFFTVSQDLPGISEVD